jgi:hypothetical protein
MNECLNGHQNCNELLSEAEWRPNRLLVVGDFTGDTAMVQGRRYNRDTTFWSLYDVEPLLGQSTVLATDNRQTLMFCEPVYQ